MVVVGGLDPGGGAGLLRDTHTAAALGARAIAIGTAWTEQGPGVRQVEPRDPTAVREALARAVAARPAAIKIGMAVGPTTADALLAGLSGYEGPVVVDPVLATSRGGPLWQGEPRGLLPLLRRATLVTPNAPEAAALAGQPIATADDAHRAAAALLEREGLTAVLVKGGHLRSEGPMVDVLVTSTSVRRFEHPRAGGASPRGTGCALATAIAIGLGKGQPLASAVQTAADWLAAAIATARPVGDERHLG